MKASEYRAELRAAYEAGREAIPFETCVEMCAARYVWPEFEKSLKWRLEFEYVCNKYRVGVGLKADGRFANALRREVANAQASKKYGEVPPWVKDLAEKRYFIPVPVEGEESAGGPPAPPEGEISRSEGGLGSGTGKDRPEGRGANCNGVATGPRGRCGTDGGRAETAGEEKKP